MADNYKLDFTGEEVNDLLHKAANSIGSSDIADLASESYVDDAIDSLDIPVVDQTLNLNSENAIANKAVVEETENIKQNMQAIERYNTPVIEGVYGGNTWIDRTLGSHTSVRFLNGSFFIAGDKLWKSVDGTAWTSQQLESKIGDIAYGNGIYIASVLNSSRMYISTDAESWTAISNNASLGRILFVKDKFIGANFNMGTLYYSYDGETWVNTEFQNGNNCYLDYDGTNIINSSSGGISISPDGINWSIISHTPASGKGVAYDGKQYICPTDTIIYSSYDLVTWTPVYTAPSKKEMRGCIYAGGQFVVVGGNRFIVKSQDGVNWVAQTTGSTNAWYGSIASGNGKYVVASNSSYISYSDSNFTLDGLALTLPWEQYNTNKIVNIIAPATLTDTYLNINSLGAKTINGTIEKGKNYELVYNGASWDIKKDSAFNYQEIVVGETIFNLNKDFKCIFIGLIDGDMNAKIVPINTTVDLLTVADDKKVTITTTDKTISVLNSTDNVQYIIYTVIN